MSREDKIEFVADYRANAVEAATDGCKVPSAPNSINFKRKDLSMKKYVVEIVEKITYKVSLDAASSEDAENAARRLYDLDALENGELESVTFDAEEKVGE